MTLNDDLLRDFKEQKQIILEQINLFDPLATSLRKPAARRLMSKGGLILAEIFCYFFCCSALALTVMMNIIYPFYPLKNVRFIHNINDLSGMNMEERFSIAVHIMAGFTALLLYIMARIIRRIRLKNDILSLAGKNMKTLVGQHLKRKASIEAIEQRHFMELPAFGDYTRVNSVVNPGFDSYDYSR